MKIELDNSYRSQWELICKKVIAAIKAERKKRNDEIDADLAAMNPFKRWLYASSDSVITEKVLAGLHADKTFELARVLLLAVNDANTNVITLTAHEYDMLIDWSRD